MQSHTSLTRCLLGLTALVAAAAAIPGGCGGANPYSTLVFMNDVINHQTAAGQTFPRGGGPSIVPPTTTAPTTTTINSTCDLPTARKNITMLVRNESLQNVRYSLTFLVSAGAGGFVCDTDRASYTNAGYVSFGSSVTLGCDVITPNAANGFRGGSELLGRSIGLDAVGNPILIPPNLSGTPQGGPAAVTPLDGVTLIPLPEVIVLGNDNPIFKCQASNPCTQGGFAYTNALGVQIDDIFVSRTQGTLCNAGAGTRPEFRLHNPSSADTTAAAFEFVAGSSVTVSILDRVLNPTASQNKAVWRVIGPVPGLVTIHDEQR
ncbi:MAG: hypothetical protein U1A27_00420 [Phycisphaerae bacterium]